MSGPAPHVIPASRYRAAASRNLPIAKRSKLRRPDDEIEKHLRKKLDRAMRKGRAGLMGPVEGDSEDDDDMLSDLQKIEKRQKERYGRTQDGALAPMVDATGKEIDAIAPD